jgi:hypothetical protein
VSRMSDSQTKISRLEDQFSTLEADFKAAINDLWIQNAEQQQTSKEILEFLRCQMASQHIGMNNPPNPADGQNSLPSTQANHLNQLNSTGGSTDTAGHDL